MPSVAFLVALLALSPLAPVLPVLAEALQEAVGMGVATTPVGGAAPE